MPTGDKDKYTDKQKRQADHIETSYEKRGVSEREAESRAWATVNKMTGGGKKSGSGRGRSESARGGNSGGSSSQGSASRSEAAKKGWETRRRKAGGK